MLTSCATSGYETAAPNQQTIGCKDKADCDSKWSKAQVWLVNNSGWKIQIANDVVLQTYGPGDSTRAAFTLTKSTNADGSGSINASAACGNIFGCVPRIPPQLDSLRSFIN